MNDPQHLGLGELGQRVQAMSDPVPDSRLRPYQGAPLPVGPAVNGRPIPPYEPLPPEQLPPEPQPHESWEDRRVSPSPSPTPTPYSGQPLYPPGPGSIPGYGSANGQATGLGSFSDQPARPATPPAPVSNWEDVAAASQSSTTNFGASTPETPAPSTPPTPPASLPTAADPNAPKSGLQRAIDAVRSTLPLVQRLLPLLDGNFATAVSALVGPHTHPAPAQPVKVDLEPVERGLAEVRNSNRELRAQVQEQTASFKRVEDQLERVREATDRNTLEQQELVEDLRSVGNRVSIFAIVGLVLLAVSLVLNVFLLVQLQHILR
jgi:hypothetical protein